MVDCISWRLWCVLWSCLTGGWKWHLRGSISIRIASPFSGWDVSIGFQQRCSACRYFGQPSIWRTPWSVWSGIEIALHPSMECFSWTGSGKRAGVFRVLYRRGRKATYSIGTGSLAELQFRECGIGNERCQLRLRSAPASVSKEVVSWVSGAYFLHLVTFHWYGFRWLDFQFFKWACAWPESQLQPRLVRFRHS